MNREPIAVIGAGCRFPGAENLAAFWELLIDGRDAVTEIPDGRWSKPFYFHPEPGTRGRSYTWAAGVLDNIDGFDAAFFGISPREAKQMDPHQRLLLELGWEALEDAGIPASKLAGTAAGVYLGASGSDFAQLRNGDAASGDAYFMTGTSPAILANRLSYIFDLHGPSVTVDTACSSSLVALHFACEALRKDQIPAAMVCGVNLLLSPYPYLGFCQAAMLSKQGRCFAFDERADGYVRAEGGAVILLKRLKDAVAAGDPIRGVILGTAVNSDGRTSGLALPNEAAQSELLAALYADAGIAADRVSFIEAHGTGTPAGDPIELSAIGRTLGCARTRPLPVGSVKTNLGHLEAASGVAGLIKAMLAIENRVLPASLHCATPNPKIPLDALNLAVATAAIPLSDKAPIAGVNSFGFGGTNAHAILTAAPHVETRAATEQAPLPPLIVSARSGAALAELAGGWSRALDRAPRDAAAALIRGAARRRDHHRDRVVCAAGTAADLASALKAYASTQTAPNLIAGNAAPRGRLAFVFAGNGAQWLGMGRDAMIHNAPFRDALAEVDSTLGPLLNWSVAQAISSGHYDLSRTDIAQPLLFAVQVAIASTLRASGIEAERCVGHSVGEIAAAWAAGALSLADASRVVAIRSVQQHRTWHQGGMASVTAPADALAAEVQRVRSLEIAAINSETQFTVAGPREALDQFESVAARRGWKLRLLDLDYAFHTAVLDPVEAGVLAGLERIAPRDCGNRFVSTVSGGMLAGSVLGAEYWWRNIREPVRFRGAVAQLVAAGCDLFLEIGPHPILLSYLREGLRGLDATGQALPTLTREPCHEDPFPTIAARCWVAGYDLSPTQVFDGPCEIAGLPRYPWQRLSYHFDVTAEAVPLTAPRGEHRLLGYRRDREDGAWTNLIDLALFPWLADHKVTGSAFVPAAALIEIALAAGQYAAPAQGRGIEIIGLEIGEPLALDTHASRELSTRLCEDRQLAILSRPRFAGEDWTTHVSGRIATARGTASRPLPDLQPTGVIAADEIYARAKAMGLDYGPQFRAVSRVDLLRPDTALAQLDAPTGFSADGFIIPPPLLDGALQAFLGILTQHGTVPTTAPWLPWRFGRIALIEPLGRVPSQALVKLTQRGARSACGDVSLYDRAGRLVLEIEECWFRLARGVAHGESADSVFHVVLEPAPSRDQVPPAFDLDSILDQAPAGTHGAEEDATGLLFGAYLASTAHAALAAMLESRRHGFRIGDLVLAGVIAEESGPLLGSILKLLQTHGGAGADESGLWSLAALELPDPPVLWRTLLDDVPELAAELALSAEAGESLTLALRFGAGSARALPSALVEQSLFGSGNGRSVLERLSRALREIVARWPQNRPLRILEIAAGQGTLTRRLLRELEMGSAAYRYVATDPDPSTASQLALQFRGMPRVSVEAWDGSGKLAADNHFDMIVSAYGLTRLGQRGEIEGALYDLLDANGFLIAAEPEPNPIWDWIFGQTRGWWRGTADFPLSPLRAADERQSALCHARFQDVTHRALAHASWPVGLVAGRRKASVQTPAPGAQQLGNLLIIAPPEDALAAALVARLRLEGANPAVFAMPEIGDGAALCAALQGDPTVPTSVIVLPHHGHVAGSAGTIATELSHTLALATLVANTRKGTRCCFVTRGAQQIHAVEDGTGDAALWGLARTLANEVSDIELRLVDLPSAWETATAAEAIAHEVFARDGEREIVWTQDGRHVLRLRQAGAKRGVAQGPVVLGVETPGLLDTLAWKSIAPREPGPGEVAIQVAATGLNFRDVMWALGLLPEEALLGGYAGASFGLECAGTVTAVGPGVASLRRGDRVMAIAPAALATEVITGAHTVLPIPDAMSFEGAASIPVAFLTAYYALSYLGRLQAEEIVLIHGAAGGVGLAAIQYAKHCGARIIATAGSDAKRTFLRNLGVDHVLDSRSLGFVDEVRKVTAGAGIDVVLNSLSGEAMELSLGLLKPFGRFLELGKRDFYLDSRIGLRPMRRNVSYFGIDIDRLPVERPDLAATLLHEVADLVRLGAFRPLPSRVFPHAEVSDAFRLMQGAGHIGKIVLVSQPSEPRHADESTPRRFSVRSDATYLVTGGLSGFGLETARWLAARGARHLALLGRRGIDTPGAQELLADLAKGGVEARAFACDVADRSAVVETLAVMRGTMPALRGVVHAAMEIDDALVQDLTAERMARVLAPKLGGAINLDAVTRTDPVELFVLYSSAAAVLGAPGQASYVAANAALEAIARRRCAAGLPSLAVGWGLIADCGYLARSPEKLEALRRRIAARPLRSVEALNALPSLWETGLPTAIFASVDWRLATHALPVLSWPTFADVAAVSGERGAQEWRERLETMAPEDAKAHLSSFLRDELARILATAPDQIDLHRPLSEFGMDSLMGVELRLAVESRLGIDLPLSLLAGNATLTKIIAYLVEARAPSGPSGIDDFEAAALRYEGAGIAAADSPAGAAQPKHEELP